MESPEASSRCTWLSVVLSLIHIYLFNAQHTICLKDGTTVIHSLEEWNFVVNEQLDLSLIHI